MIEFSPQDPYPHWPLDKYTYAMAKAHAIQVDRWLGFNDRQIESGLEQKHQPRRLTDPQERWVGLDTQSFSTPYVEIRSLLELLEIRSTDHIVDLGCGYGRMAHVLGRHFPETQFTGYELVPERVEEAQRVLKPFDYIQVRIEQRDLFERAPVSAQIYFIYDFGSNRAISKTLEDLKSVASTKPISVVARGRASRALISQNHPWLSQVQDPRHFETFSIYRS